jgi:hypothetical protein
MNRISSFQMFFVTLDYANRGVCALDHIPQPRGDLCHDRREIRRALPWACLREGRSC